MLSPILASRHLLLTRKKYTTQPAKRGRRVWASEFLLCVCLLKFVCVCVCGWERERERERESERERGRVSETVIDVSTRLKNENEKRCQWEQVGEEEGAGRQGEPNIQHGLRCSTIETVAVAGERLRPAPSRAMDMHQRQLPLPKADTRRYLGVYQWDRQAAVRSRRGQ